MKFLRDGNSITAIKLGESEFCVMSTAIPIAEIDSTRCILMVAGAAYSIPRQFIEESTVYPQSDEDSCPKGHKSASMRIIHGAEALLLYLRKAETFTARNGLRV